jgi:CHAP domain-containing protein
MTPEEFTAAELAAGRLTATHVSTAVRFAQSSLKLDVDGKAGPDTRAALEAFAAANRGTEVPIGDLIVAIAVAEIGHGEAGSNNHGPDLERYLAGTGIETPAEWCAAFAGWCQLEAHRRRGIALPYVRSVGAKRQLDRLGAAGSRFLNPDRAMPGDLIAWHRGPEGSASGHIGVVEYVSNGIVHSIEGNTGSYPSKVRRFAHDIRHERLYGFASLRIGVTD